MRLEENEIIAIKKIIKSLDSGARIFLFGSRVDDTRKGGDIDLLVLSDVMGVDEMISAKVDIQTLIGEQKIDILIQKHDPATHDAFSGKALREGVEL